MATKKKKPTLNQQLYQKELRRLKQFIRRTEKRGFHYAEDVIPEKPKRITKKSIERLQKLTPQELYKKATYKDPTTGAELTGTQGRQSERQRAANKGAKTRASLTKSKLTTNEQPKTPEEKDLPKEQPKTPEEKDLPKEQPKTPEEKDLPKEQPKTPEEKDLPKEQPKPPEEKDLPQATYEIIENVREEIRKWTPSSGWTEFFTESKRRDKNILENMLEGAIRQEGADVIAARLEAHSYEVLSIIQEILYGSGGKDGNQINNDFARFSQILLGRGLTVEESIDLANAQEYTEDFEEDLVEE